MVGAVVAAAVVRSSDGKVSRRAGGTKWGSDSSAGYHDLFFLMLIGIVFSPQLAKRDERGQHQYSGDPPIGEYD